jgi:hypothetical protein
MRTDLHTIQLQLYASRKFLSRISEKINSQSPFQLWLLVIIRLKFILLFNLVTRLQTCVDGAVPHVVQCLHSKQCQRNARTRLVVSGEKLRQVGCADDPHSSHDIKSSASPTAFLFAVPRHSKHTARGGSFYDIDER